MEQKQWFDYGQSKLDDLLGPEDDRRARAARAQLGGTPPVKGGPTGMSAEWHRSQAKARANAKAKRRNKVRA